MKRYNFDKVEIQIENKFNDSFADDIEILTNLISHLESLITQLNNKIKSGDSPNDTIELFLANNLTLLYNSFNRLQKGYLGISQALLRPVLESISLSMYFHEFPEDIQIYTKDPKNLYRKITKLKYKTIENGEEVEKNYLPWIEGALQRVDKEGTKFTQREDMKGETWYKFIFKNLTEEAGMFLHANPDWIYGIVYGGESKGILEYKFGPNWQSDLLIQNALWKIIETILYNTIVLDRVFKQHITNNDFTLIKNTTNKLNIWKKEYLRRSNESA
jgi:hypothetical protein